MNRKHGKTRRLVEAGWLVASLLAMLGYAWAAQEATATLASIEISLKVDPRLTKGLYMGDRWVSMPATYTGTVGQDTVEARVSGVDAKGGKVAVHPKWTPADPEMVTVSPAEGNEVKIIVKRAGESRLKINSQSVSKELAIKAAYKGEIIHVEIAQLETEAPAQVSSVPEDPAFKSPKEKLSYAIGANIATGVRKQALDVDLEVLIQGIKDALGGKMRMTADQMKATLLSAQEGMKKQMGHQLEKTKELAERNREEGGAFLAGNKAKEGVVTLESGLQYKILKAGDGAKPAAADAVVCNYRGTLIDGTEFDSSYNRGKPATFPVNRVIKGWTEALQLMPAGSRWQLFIPSNLAYGERGAPGGKIGPNATLIFEVELISIQDKSPNLAGGPKPETSPN